MNTSKYYVEIDEGRSLTLEGLKAICGFSEQMPYGFYVQHEDDELMYANRKLAELYDCDSVDEFLSCMRDMCGPAG